jgi:type I restriction enzyme R subunit
LGLQPYELAFYDALAQNQSARDVMGQDQLRELAIVLVARVRQNASIDWNLKESVRARMKVMVKRLLRQYGYPPDMQALAIELVLEQAKVFTEFEVELSVSVKGKQATAKVDRPTSICPPDCGSQAVKYCLAISRCLDKPLFP